MLKLVELPRVEGGLVWMNPEHVVAVVDDDTPGPSCYVHHIGGTEIVAVPAEDVVARLQSDPSRADPWKGSLVGSA